MRGGLLLLVALLSGCDVWPTAFANRSEDEVTFRYHLRGYDTWSGPRVLKKMTGQRLARASWMKDILGVRVSDKQHCFEWTAAQIQLLNVNYNAQHGKQSGGDWIVYLGEGKLGVSDTAHLPRYVTHDELGKEL